MIYKVNNLDAYKGKIERVAKKKNFVKKEKWDRYVIKWTDRELSIIERKFKEEVIMNFFLINYF